MAALNGKGYTLMVAHFHFTVPHTLMTMLACDQKWLNAACNSAHKQIALRLCVARK